MLSRNAFMGAEPAPMWPSPSSTARRNAASAYPPNQIGGCGFCTGFGSIGMLMRCEKRPSSVTFSSLHDGEIFAEAGGAALRCKTVSRIVARAAAQPHADNEPAVRQYVN